MYEGIIKELVRRRDSWIEEKKTNATGQADVADEHIARGQRGIDSWMNKDMLGIYGPISISIDGSIHSAFGRDGKLYTSTDGVNWILKG